MRVHSAAVLPEDRLRHERREEPELGRHVLHDETERRDVVRRLERVGIAEVDFMLAVRDFVVRRLYFEPHALERVDHRAARVFAKIGRREVEIPADVVRRRGRPAAFVRLEEKELRLHARVHRVAHRLRLREHRFQRAARVAGKRRAVRRR